jgi:hypothetical protein
MTEHTESSGGRYNLVAVKRRWVPEWLWRVACIWQLPLRQPFRRWMTSDKPEALKMHMVPKEPR